MNKIEQLIKELCPGGVQHIQLEELCEFRNGYTPSKANKDFWEGGDIPWFRMEDIRENGRILSDSIQHITSKAIKGAGLFKANSIILATTATIGEHAMIIADSLANQRFTNLSIRKSLSPIVGPKYLFYYMFLVDEWCKNHVNVSGFASVDMPGLKKLPIPLPPLPIQEEIVRILDTFTEAQANLEQELELRKKQYEYYRNKLLTFDENDSSVKWMKVGTFCDTLSGFPFDSSKFSKEGIRLMRGMNVKRGYFDFNDEDDRYWLSSEGLEKYLLNEKDIIISMDGSLVGRSFAMLEKIHLPLLLVQRVARIRSSNVNQKYLYFNITKDFADYVDKKKTAGAIPHVSMKDIENFCIPVPSKERQQEIVSTLDKFESAIQTLEEELALRKKQYEYYREKLLTFN